MLPGCVSEKDKTDETKNDDTAETTSQIYNILLSSLSDYDIVRPENAASSETEAAKLVFNAIKNKFGADVTIKTDFIKPGDAKYSAGEYEILIGDTNREESAGYRAVMRIDDYGYGLVGKKLVITGVSAEKTYLAAEKFVSDIINSHADGNDIFYSGEYDYMYVGSYMTDSFTLNGININEYGIVYKYGGDGGERLLAEKLQNSIAAASGYRLETYSDKETAKRSHEILIGTTSRETGGIYSRQMGESEYFIGTCGANILVWANSLSGNTAAICTLTDRINAACSESRSAALTIGEAEILKSNGDNLMSVMSFNVLVSNITAERSERVTTMVLNYLPDTVGFQEASSTWVNKLNASLNKYYSYVGEGRDGGNSGEYNPIFYRKDKFTVVESGTKWLSDTPDRVSKYSESSLNRILTYVVLKRKSDGKIFVHINTHLEHTSSEARIKQATVLAGFINKYPDYPVILTGDFNCSSGTDEYKIIDSTFLASSADIALKKENAGATFHGYGTSSKIIDFIFVSDKNIIVSLYKVANEMINGDYASDHYPVYAEYTIIY
jgi:endonuclease/exonuclease/phosphatase family metal-dependent hydrolase